MPKPRKGITKPCAFCGVDVYRIPVRATTTNFFCSKAHNTAFMKANSFCFTCQVCGIAVFTQPYQMEARNRITCSHKCRSVIRRIETEARRAKEGFTKHQLDRAARYSPEAAVWRKAVFQRDDYTCQACGVRGSYLEADHTLPWAFFPDIRYELLNGQTLCRKCHDKTKISYKVMRAMYG